MAILVTSLLLKTNICTIKERLDQIKHSCGNKYAPLDFLNMETGSLKKFVKWMIVDDKHQVLYCHIAKAG